MILTTCAACAAPLALDAPVCVRCRRLADTAAFREHCFAVKHGEGFAYECEEIYEVAS